jgi:hypothetical protein
MADSCVRPAVRLSIGEFGYPVLVRLGIALVWAPLISYVGAQRRRRSHLVEELARAEDRREVARQRAGRSAEAVRRQIVDLIRGVVCPALEETRTRLLIADPPPSLDEMRSIGASLKRAIVATRDAVELLSPQAPTVMPRMSPHLEPQVHAPPFVSLRAMLRQALADVACGALAVPFLRSPRDAPAAPIARVVLLPVCAGLSVGVVSRALIITAVNRRLVSTLPAVEADEVTQSTMATAIENAVRNQLEFDVHGPILGRLSACVMAISFYLAHQTDASRTQPFNLTSAILSHLDAVRDDLASLIKPDRRV